MAHILWPLGFVEVNLMDQKVMAEILAYRFETLQGNNLIQVCLYLEHDSFEPFNSASFQVENFLLAFLNRVGIYKVMHHNTLDLNKRVIRMSGEPLFEFVMVNFGLNKGQCLSLKWKIRTEVRTEGAPSGEK